MPGDTDFLPYLEWGTEQLLERLALVCSTIADLVDLEAEAKVQELGSRAEAFRRSDPGAGPTARRQVMDVEAVPAAQTLLETQAKMASLREEKAFLLTLIDVRTRARQPEPA